MFSGENISHYDPEHGYIEMTTPIMDTTANTTDENGKGIRMPSGALC